MRNDLTEVILIADRSGSMKSCCEEAQNGINVFIEEQKNGAGECRLTLTQFDTEYEILYSGISVNEAPKYTLEPRGMTALLDSIGTTINAVGERLDKTPEEEKPGLVVVVITTDGQENASNKFSKSDIVKIISTQQDIYNWQFIFLGAKQDAFTEATSIGIPDHAAANYSVEKSVTAYAVTASNVGRMRSAKIKGQEVVNELTNEERNSMI